MAVHALRGAGLDPSYVVGGELRSTGSNAGWGTGEWIVVEADESDRSLLKLDPRSRSSPTPSSTITPPTPPGWSWRQTFATFMARAGDHAVVWDRPALRALCPPGGGSLRRRRPELAPGGIALSLARHRGRLSVPGAHNAVNAAGALTACALAGADPAPAAAALADFRAPGGGWSWLGHDAPAGAAVYDDYAHHPTEVAAAIAAARTLAPRRLVAVFQPHLFSRTRALAPGFGAALAAADAVVVLPVYPARERAADFPGVEGP